MTKTFSPWLLALAVGVLALSLVGCRSFSNICNEENKCSDGNDKDLDACIVEAQHTEELASELGCGSEFDAVFDCYEEKAECNNNSYGLTDDDCETVSREYSYCMKY
jgi:hypothetical protein